MWCSSPYLHKLVLTNLRRCLTKHEGSMSMRLLRLIIPLQRGKIFILTIRHALPTR